MAVPRKLKVLPTERLVELAVVEKELVEVALVPVALEKVKFWRVVEPVTSRAELTVEEALEKKPLKSPSVVEVACMVPEVRKG